MRQTLTDLFAPPVFDVHTKHIAGQVLHYALILTNLICLAGIPIFLALPRNRILNLILLTGLIFVCTGMLFGVHRGYVYTVGRMYTGLVWVLVTYLSLITRGILSPYLLVYVVVVILSSVIVGPYYSAGYGLLSIVSLSLMLIFHDAIQQVDFLPEQSNQTHILNWFAYLVTLIQVIFLIVYLSRTTGRTLFQLQQREEELASRNQQLEAEIAVRRSMEAELISSELRFRQIFEYAPVGILLTGADYQPQAANRALCDLLGMREAKILSQKTPDLLSDEDMPDAMDLARQLMDGEIDSYRAERRLRTGSGVYLPVQVTVTAIRDSDGDFQYAISMIEDLSEMKAAEQQRIALDVERSRVAFLRDFVGNMTHDLKTPVTTINTGLYLLRRQVDPRKQRQQIEKIGRQTKLLAKMIDDILKIAQLDNLPDLTLTELNLNQLVQRVEEQLAAEVTHKNQTLQVELMSDVASILADEAELYRAMMNLIENAVKYTPEAGIVRVKTYRDRQDVVLEVQDTGIGIPETDLPHIFDRFYRSDHARDFEVGTGLGLAIVRRVVDLHQGSIDVRSCVGEGTRFRLRFPAVSSGVSAASASV